jgi:hypothetical protein
MMVSPRYRKNPENMFERGPSFAEFDRKNSGAISALEASELV